MKKLFFGIFVLLMAFCFYSIADAKDFYLRADLGIAQSNKVSGNQEAFYKRSSKKFTEGFAYLAGIGYKLNHNFRTELTYNSIDDLRYSANVDGTAYKQKLKLHALTANVIYDIQLLSKYKFNPYLGVGAGYAQSRPGVASMIANNLTTNYKAKNSSSFTYAVSCGIAFHLNTKLDLGISYRFQDFGRVKNLSSVQLPNTSNYTSYTAKSGLKIRTHSVMAGIGYNF